MGNTRETDGLHISFHPENPVSGETHLTLRFNVTQAAKHNFQECNPWYMLFCSGRVMFSKEPKCTQVHHFRSESMPREVVTVQAKIKNFPDRVKQMLRQAQNEKQKQTIRGKAYEKKKKKKKKRGEGVKKKKKKKKKKS